MKFNSKLHSSPKKSRVSKSPSHSFLPSKVIGELSSEGILTEWGRMSTGNRGKPDHKKRQSHY
jgi:hypothetical protein